ncbi:hypothetical protein PIB30_093947, partial [Stylosanthes scabra]|nr:hypothetical protein [Stylosanthes scabra]
VNGTICLSQYEHNEGRNVVFWNPTTNEFKDIPVDLPRIHGFDLIFSWTRFGYDSLRDDYILIRDGQYFSSEYEDLLI